MSISDAELRAMLEARAARADAQGLREAALAAARSEPQVHPLRGIRTSLAPGRSDPSGAPRVLRRRPSLSALLAAAAVVVAIVLVAVASGALGPAFSGHGGGVGAGTSTSSATPSPFAGLPSPTNVRLTPPPYTSGTCPVTPTTDLFGGVTPEIVASGVSWPVVAAGPGWPVKNDGWYARRAEKLVLFNASRTPIPATTFIAAVQLPLNDSSETSRLGVRYMPIGNPAVYGVTLPAPGCWLLTLVGPDVASSIVVQAGPEPSAPPPAGSDQQVPTETLPLDPLTTCPTSPTAQEATGVWGPGPPPADADSLDPNGVRWYTHPPQWVIGKPDKLVLEPPTAPQPYERIVATPVGTVNRPPAFVTSKPVMVTPVPGGGAISAGIAIPTAGCWAFTYVDPIMTSTVVVAVAAAP
ncbi:MAG TPA: hypothetical protein VFW92_02340 [Candidatus Limnocylindrales bacterium]|nr:hypothetical protein [Candidatus Limnocylindrales bacterium]